MRLIGRGDEVPRVRPLPSKLGRDRLWSGVRVTDLLIDSAGTVSDSCVGEHVVTIAHTTHVDPDIAFVDGPHFAPGAWSDEGPAPAIFVIPALWPFRASWPGHASSVLGVSLTRELVARVASELGQREPELRPMRNGDPFIAAMGRAYDVLLGMDENAFAVQAESVTHALAAHLVRNYTLSQPKVRRQARTELSLRHLRRVEDYVAAHLDERVLLSDMAALAEMSVHHFARTFRARTGMTPHVYVMRKRIEVARAMLAVDQLAIADIALRCGFNQQSHFATTFRRMTGMTPRSFRAQHRSR